MSTQALKLIETDSKFVEAVSTMTEWNGDNWYNIPFWYRKVGEGLYVEYRFEDLPEGFKKHLSQLREEIKEL